jgi:hypothetical protein
LAEAVEEALEGLEVWEAALDEPEEALVAEEEEAAVVEVVPLHRSKLSHHPAAYAGNASAPSVLRT